MTFKRTVSSYYNLAKPGIIYGNLLTATAGYLFASQWHNHYYALVAMLVGLGLIIGCGCAINNVIDIELDRAMERTSKRALVIGHITPRKAIIYGVVLGLIGSFLLYRYTNTLTLLVALFGLITYLAFYGYTKRKTVFGTLVGAFAGAVPPLVGYCSVTNVIDLPGLILVMILICWQLSHFYAISLYRKSDYQAAKLPLWPIVKGDDSTKLQILAFMLVFAMFSISLFILGYCGFIYLLLVLILSFWWFVSAYRSVKHLPTKLWGKKVFLNSLIVILVISLALAIGPVAP